MSIILDPPLAALALVSAGDKKSHLPFYKMSVLGFLAGFFLSFGGQVLFSINTNADGSAPSGPQKFLSSCAFSIGLSCIIIAGAELFTGNCLLIMAVLAKKITVLEMLWDWLVVYFSNFLGSIIGAALIYGAGVSGGYDFSNVTASDAAARTVGFTICKAAISKSEQEPHESFFRGILANVLVCLAVIMATASKSATGKVLVIFLAIGTFIVSSYEHSIANMYTFSIATMLKCPVENHGLYWQVLVLCTIGNILGAAILAVSYWAVYVMPAEQETLHLKPAQCATELPSGQTAEMVRADCANRSSGKAKDDNQDLPDPAAASCPTQPAEVTSAPSAPDNN